MKKEKAHTLIDQLQNTHLLYLAVMASGAFILLMVESQTMMNKDLSISAVLRSYAIPGIVILGGAIGLYYSDRKRD